MSAAGYYDMIADQGATFSQVITWKSATGTPVNLSGYSARMQVRARVDSTTEVLDLSSQGGNPKIVLGGSAGTITITVPDGDMDFEGSYVYDLEVESSGGVVTRLLMGRFQCRPEVTR
jgi:hypothetical protein